eukprot:TRINITY_DN7658_c0_g1_i1.p2 TRINITY_DN7658_c0_g1~~TRINITY_DN7658_c0_g1_i1.p2  ORF type:complete len:108 (+),score=26.09 TRINITY_DN7658_c0_g1_i1:39-326(+)
MFERAQHEDSKRNTYRRRASFSAHLRESTHKNIVVPIVGGGNREWRNSEGANPQNDFDKMLHDFDYDVGNADYNDGNVDDGNVFGDENDLLNEVN